MADALALGGDEGRDKLQAYGILYIKRADGTFVSENYNQKMLGRNIRKSEY